MLSCRKVLWSGLLFLLLFPLAGLHVYAKCQGEDAGGGVVAEISGGETLVLHDGRAVRLIGVLGPKRATRGPASDARAMMQDALLKLTLGKQVTLQTGKRKRDRYGRLLAQVMLDDGKGSNEWVQGRLVSDGLVRVISFRDNRLCIVELLALEDEARRKGRGLWGNGFFAVRPAMAENLLYRLAQSYEIIEGRVVDVAAVKGRTYLNFGKDWKRDFTAFIPANTASLFSQSRTAPQKTFALHALAGKQIRVRGWLKNYNGPSITISHPEQIELVNPDASITGSAEHGFH